MSTVMADPMLPSPYHVQRVRRETRDTFTLELTSVHDEDRFSFAPGQFTMLYVFGVGEVPISISGDPTHPHPLLHTIRAVGTGTRALQRLKRGEVVGVRGPFGSQWPMEEVRGSDIVLVAGGIGLAPLRPVLLQVLSQRQRYGRVILLYGVRTPQDLLYARELENWRGRFDLDIEVTVDNAMDTWHGQVGVVTQFISKAPFDSSSTVAMICGPEVMMRFTVLELRKRGVEAENIYVSLERNMKCAIGLCGHCQLGPVFICKDGPVFRYERILPLLGKREI